MTINRMASHMIWTFVFISSTQCTLDFHLKLDHLVLLEMKWPKSIPAFSMYQGDHFLVISYLSRCRYNYPIRLELKCEIPEVFLFQMIIEIYVVYFLICAQSLEIQYNVKYFTSGYIFYFLQTSTNPKSFFIYVYLIVHVKDLRCKCHLTSINHNHVCFAFAMNNIHFAFKL